MNMDTIQSMAIGASGGVPLTMLLLHTIKNMKESFDKLQSSYDKLREGFDAFKDRLEKMSERLQKVEVVLEVTHQKEIKGMQERLGRLEKAIFERPL